MSRSHVLLVGAVTKPPASTVVTIAIAAIGFAFLPPFAHASPSVPSDDSEIVETLEARAPYASLRELTALQERFDNDPSSESLALQLAQKYLARADVLAQPKYFPAASRVLKSFLFHQPENERAHELLNVIVEKQSAARTNAGVPGEENREEYGGAR